MAEKAGRLKMLIDDAGGHFLGRFEDLEILALGILGKRSLWRALAAANVPEFKAVAFGRLEARAEEQYARVEARRLELARDVLPAPHNRSRRALTRSPSGRRATPVESSWQTGLN